MGNSFTNRKPAAMIFEGLDDAGKTSLLYRLKNPKDEIVTTVPTIGFNMETIEMGKLTVISYDVGGRNRTLSQIMSRNLVNDYDSVGFCFLIDSTDAERIDESKDYMMTYFQRHQQYLEFQQKIKSILILANKQDLPNALSPSEIVNKLDIRELERLTQCPICVLGCSVKDNTGIKEAIEWMSYSMTNFYAIQKSIKKAIAKDEQQVSNGYSKKEDSRSIKTYLGYIKQLLMY